MLCDICNTWMSRTQYMLHRASDKCKSSLLDDSRTVVSEVTVDKMEVVVYEAEIMEDRGDIVLDESVTTLQPSMDEDVLKSRVDVVENGEEIVLKESVDKPLDEAASPSVQFTKKGTIRIRRSNSLSVKERKERKMQLYKAKYALKPIVDCCKKKCISKINEGRRIEINAQYLKLGWKERKTFILNTCDRMPVKRKSVEDGARKNTWKYFFSNKDSIKQSVCKKFFLTTLGYKPNNDRAVFEVLNKTPTAAIAPLADGRGKHVSDRKYKHDDLIDAHIESFEPTVSHYRREHAPIRRYLPSDVTITMMHNDFTHKYPEQQISYEYYRLAIKKKNISFATLGHEECEFCEKFCLHGHDADNLNNDCDDCQQYINHKIRYEEARELYKKDAELNDGSIFSVDLQKVIMLPRLDAFKKVIFTKRIVAYHESFVPLGKKAHGVPMACIWHEGVTGRNKEDIVSTFYAFFLRQRDSKKITLWLDNCSSQNKNWYLLSFLVYIVNSDEVDMDEIQLKYFEPGHTYMSADSFYHQVELSMKKQKVYDFPDFSKAVQNANKGKVDVKEMTFSDIYMWKDNKSQQKLKKSSEKIYLKNIVAVRTRRGKFTMEYKTSHTEEFTKQLDFLCKKSSTKKISKPPQLDKPRGVAQDKIDDILSNLSSLMPASRKIFWNNLKNI
ncbi:uncharacterized protein LOC124808549 [Hydra vulgaris]|uniref:uncharacterized protein LOC124808549 n=1 Tax=Hydra vulgaris TaxID=6087 RepID=UPI001F5F0C77|nr:uncharacterized protein LOC124808549 [Hydra vulgaris]